MLHHAPTTEKQFLGRGLVAINRIHDSEVELLFDGGYRSTLNIDGDCCSSSIIYEIRFPAACVGAEITSIEEGAPGDTEEDARKKVEADFPDFSFEELSVWDVVIHTKNGDVRLKHINSSNGYYDGYTIWSAPKRVGDSPRTGLTSLN